MHVKDLTPDPQNRRKHTPRNIGMLVEALHKVGAGRSIVIDEHGEVLAGNGVVEAAAEAGITKVQVVDADGSTVIAVRRTGLSAEQKRELAIYDNRVAELAEWDWARLKQDQAEGLTLEPWFTPEELAAGSGAVEPKAGLTDPDAVPEQRATDIKPGDLFELGKHRLLCGDSTKSEDVSRVIGDVVPMVMVADLPYGCNYDPGWRDSVLHDGSKRSTGKVANDDNADWSPAIALFRGDVAYLWHYWLAADVVKVGLQSNGFDVRYQLVWAKARQVFGRGHYHGQHEVVWYAVRSGGSAHWSGDRSQSTLWKIDTDALDARTDHSTQKPVECMERPIRNHGGAGDAVYDPFVGSGTTLIAAERQQRVCYAIELMPAYVQMAIDRWEAFTGQKAVKVGELVSA